MSSIKVGFIGLGNMGMIMAKKLAENGIKPTVYDLRNEAVQEMVALGAKGARSCREVAEKSDVIISMVRDIPQTDEILFGKDGVWAGVREGATIVLSSSLSSSYCQEVYNKAKQRKVRIIDAPVSTEERSFAPGKEFAVLTLMVGGDDDAVERCMPVFQAMTKNVIPQGGIGTGQVCKLVNNLAMYANGIVARECVNLGLKAGLDLEKMKKAMSLSTGNSRALMGIGRASPFPPPPKPPAAGAPGGKPFEDLGTKDKRLALEVAEEAGAQTPVVKFMEQLDLESTYDALSTRAQRQRRTPP
jgi:3-hydroxyisobutyrate dehydrogenase-like beta-hydroxyacid dehydrogenase